MVRSGFDLQYGQRVALLGNGELEQMAAKSLGLVVAWREDLQQFEVVSGNWPRAVFGPLDSDADAFLLPCLLPDLPVGLILRRAHAAFNQVWLIPAYVRRNLVLAAAERSLATEAERVAYGW